MPGSPRGRSFAEGGAQALGAAVRTARRNRRMTQEELARAVGRDKSTIERLEGGRQPSLNDALVEQVAEILDADEVTLQHWKDLALNGPGAAVHYLTDDDEDEDEGGTLAERVQVMVESSHRSQATFARQAGISARTLQRILGGRNPDGVTVKVAEGLATAAGLIGREREAFIAFGCRPGRSPAARRMIGRRNDLARVAEGLARTGLVTITGPPGVGKTLVGLAAAEARQVSGQSADFVFLRAIPEGTSLAAAVAMSKGLDLPADEAPNASLADRAPASGLLFLDNVEHLTGVENALESLRASRPDLFILVTKPVPLGISGEVTVDLAPLSPRNAVRLLRARIAAARGPLPPSPADDQVLDGICARIGYLPLVIELVANWFTDRSPAEVSVSLDGGEHLVTLGESVRRTLLRLDSTAQAMFGGMSLVAEPWTPDLIVSACAPEQAPRPQVLAARAALERSGLVRRQLDGPHSRFTMLRPVADIARHELSGDKRTEFAERHAAYVLQIAHVHAPALVGKGASEASRYLEPRAGHVLAAAEFWLARRDPRSLELVALAWRYWQIRAQNRLGLSVLRRAREVVSAPDPAIDAQAAYGEAVLLHQLGLDGAVGNARHALALFRSLGDGQGVGAVMSLLGMIAHYDSPPKLDEGRRWFEDGLNEVPWERAPQARATLLGNYAAVLWDMNDAKGAFAAARDAADHYEQEEDFRNLSAQHGNLAHWEFRSGNFAAAQASLVRARDGLSEATDAEGITEVRLLQAELLLARGEQPENLDGAARELVQAGLRLEVSTNPWHLAMHATLEAELLLLRGDHHRALDAARRALDLPVMLNYPEARARGWMIAAYAESIERGPQAAVETCAGALDAAPDAVLTIVTGAAAVLLAAAQAADTAVGRLADPLRLRLRAAVRDHPDLPTAAARHTLRTLRLTLAGLTADSFRADLAPSSPTPASLRYLALTLARALLAPVA